MLTKQEINDAIPYLSASRLHTYMQCPSSFFFKYIYKIADDETNDSYAKYGTLCHNIFENMANGEYEDVETPINEYIASYHDCGLKDSQYDDYYEQGICAIHEKWEWLQSIDIVQAEAKFSAKPLDDVPKFYGFVDLVYRDEHGRLIVRDYKSSKKYTNPQLSKNIQAYFYAEACKALYGEYPFAFEFDFFRFGKKTVIITDENYIKFNRIRVQGIWKQIEKGIQVGKYNPFFCENFCECRSNCPLFQNRKVNRK